MRGELRELQSMKHCPELHELSWTAPGSGSSTTGSEEHGLEEHRVVESWGPGSGVIDHGIIVMESESHGIRVVEPWIHRVME